ILYQVPGFVGEIHLDQYVTRANASFSNGLFAALYFDDLFRRNQDTPKRGFQPFTLDALYERLMHAFFHSGINVDNIPTLAHVCPLFPAQQQAIDDPLQTFVDDPQQESHCRDEHENDARHLRGFFTRRPDHTLDFVIGVAAEAQGAAAGLAEPCDDGGKHQAAQEHADANDGGLGFEHRVADDAGHDNKHRQTQLDAICATANGFYVAIRHIPACDATCAAAMRLTVWQGQ